jgi:hypothetical protein
MLGPNEEKYLHPAEYEYIAFRPVKVREEKRRMWVGNRYEMRLCEVYDAGASMPVCPFSSDRWREVPESTYRRKRTRDEVQELVDKVSALLICEPMTAKQIAQTLHETPATIRGLLRKKNFRILGGEERRKGVGGPEAHQWGVAEGWEGWHK